MEILVWYLTCISVTSCTHAFHFIAYNLLLLPFVCTLRLKIFHDFLLSVTSYWVRHGLEL